MGNDTSMQGTGDTLGRIPIGDHGVLLIVDDGCMDADVITRWEDPNGDQHSFGIALNRLRRHEGDDAVCEIFEAVEKAIRGEGDDSPTLPPIPRYTGGPFVCVGCGRTWPSKYNQTPDNATGHCPDCYDDEGGP